MADNPARVNFWRAYVALINLGAASGGISREEVLGLSAYLPADLFTRADSSNPGDGVLRSARQTREVSDEPETEERRDILDLA